MSMHNVVRAALDTLADDNDSSQALRPHFEWLAGQLITQLGPGDLSTAELVALVSVLIPAHARAVGGVGVNAGNVPAGAGTGKWLHAVR